MINPNYYGNMKITLGYFINGVGCQTSYDRTPLRLSTALMHRLTVDIRDNVGIINRVDGAPEEDTIYIRGLDTDVEEDIRTRDYM